MMSNYNPKVIILISGKRKSGKDFLAEKLRYCLANSGGCAVILRISAPLKMEFAKLHGLSFDRLSDSSSYKEEFRKEMVRWSDDIRRRDPFFFCQSAVSEIMESIDVWIISDIRRPADVRYFVENFANKFLIPVIKIRLNASNETRIKRGWKFECGIDDAETECALDDGILWDFVLTNDESVSAKNEFEILFNQLFNHVLSFIRPQDRIS